MWWLRELILDARSGRSDNLGVKRRAVSLGARDMLPRCALDAEPSDVPFTRGSAMKKHAFAVPVLALTLTLSGCERDMPTSPEMTSPSALQDGSTALQRAAPPRGTGLVLNNVITLPVDIIGEVPVTVDAVITGLQFSAIAGLTATFDLVADADVAGTRLIAEDLTTAVSLSSGGGGGGCEVVSVDLAPINVNAAGLAVVDIPVADVDVKAEGAVGNLLCTVTRLVNSLAPISAVTGVVNALTGLLGGGGGPSLPPAPARGS